MPSLGAHDLLLAQLDDAVVELADVLAQALDLLLHVDDGHVGDDAERGVEQVADLLLAVLLASPSTAASSGSRSRRGASASPRLPGGVLQHGVDGLHQALGLLVGGIALARVLRRFGGWCRRRGWCLQLCAPALRLGRRAGRLRPAWRCRRAAAAPALASAKPAAASSARSDRDRAIRSRMTADMTPHLLAFCARDGGGIWAFRGAAGRIQPLTRAFARPSSRLSRSAFTCRASVSTTMCEMARPGPLHAAASAAAHRRRGRRDRGRAAARWRAA